MKSLVALMALSCLLFAAPVPADDVEPLFLDDSPALTESLDGATCEQSKTDLFPEADKTFLASCTNTTTCGSWSYSCGCPNNTAKRTRTCRSLCCPPEGSPCLDSGPYTQSECTPITC